MADNRSVKPGEGGIIKELNPNDVLAGRGPSSYSHPGNVLFRRLCLQKWQSYANSPKRSGEKKVPKKILMAEVVTYFRNMNPPGRFLHHNEEDDGHWIEIGDKKAIEKAVYLLRGTDLSPDGNGTTTSIKKNDADSPRLSSLTSSSSQPSSAQSTARSTITSERMSTYHQLRNERAFSPTLPTTFDLENTTVDIEELMTSSIGEWEEDQERRVNKNHTRGDVTDEVGVAETTPLGRVNEHPRKLRRRVAVPFLDCLLTNEQHHHDQV